jgi:hypothetical protein
MNFINLLNQLHNQGGAQNKQHFLPKTNAESGEQPKDTNPVGAQMVNNQL